MRVFLVVLLAALLSVHAQTTDAPATTPTAAPTTQVPTPTTETPTAAPTTQVPTAAPTTETPTAAPTTQVPTAAPTTETPTAAPTTQVPTAAPTTETPTAAPTTQPPTVAPSTQAPTVAPSTQVPTVPPTTAAPAPQGKRLIEVKLNLNFTNWGATNQSAFQKVVGSVLGDNLAFLPPKEGSVVETFGFSNISKDDTATVDNAITILKSAVKSAAFDIFNVSGVRVVDTEDDPNKLTPGAVAGIVIGVVVFVIILGFVFIKVQRSRRDESAEYQKMSADKV